MALRPLQALQAKEPGTYSNKIEIKELMFMHQSRVGALKPAPGAVVQNQWSGGYHRPGLSSVIALWVSPGSVGLTWSQVWLKSPWRVRSPAEWAVRRKGPR